MSLRSFSLDILIHFYSFHPHWLKRHGYEGRPKSNLHTLLRGLAAWPTAYGSPQNLFCVNAIKRQHYKREAFHNVEFVSKQFFYWIYCFLFMHFHPIFWVHIKHPLTPCRGSSIVVKVCSTASLVMAAINGSNFVKLHLYKNCCGSSKYISGTFCGKTSLGPWKNLNT